MLGPFSNHLHKVLFHSTNQQEYRLLSQFHLIRFRLTSRRSPIVGYFLLLLNGAALSRLLEILLLFYLLAVLINRRRLHSARNFCSLFSNCNWIVPLASSDLCVGQFFSDAFKLLLTFATIRSCPSWCWCNKRQKDCFWKQRTHCGLENGNLGFTETIHKQ